MEHHIVRTMEIMGYQNTVSRGDIVILDDKAYVVTYILDQEVTQIDPTIKHKYTLLVSDKVEVNRSQNMTIRVTPDYKYYGIPRPGSVYNKQYQTYVIIDILRTYFEFATMVFDIKTLDMDTSDLEEKFKEAKGYTMEDKGKYPEVYQVTPDSLGFPMRTQEMLYNF